MVSARPTDDAATFLLESCAWPSEAYWRMIELLAVRTVGPLAPPVLEVGCGDGAFTELAGIHVDHAIDSQPRAVERARRRTHVYGRVTQIAIHELDPAAIGRFQTVFANSVLEHVPAIDSALERCRAVLLPGGRLVASVPLAEMNEHLTFTARSYVRARQRQLEHRNLWSLEEWRRRLDAAGFGVVSATPYLTAASCRRWDAIDALACVGRGRYRLGPAARRALSLALPTRVKRPAKRRLAHALDAWASAPAESPGCAAVLVASATT